MPKEKKIQPDLRGLEDDELMIALTSIDGLLNLALTEHRDRRIAEAHTITSGLIKRLKAAPTAVIIVLEGMVQNVIGLDSTYILDFDSLLDMTCPFCLERNLSFPRHEDLWLCPHCLTDLAGYQHDSVAQTHQEPALIVNRIRSRWISTRYDHGAPGEAKPNDRSQGEKQ